MSRRVRNVGNDFRYNTFLTFWLSRQVNTLVDDPVDQLDSAEHRSRKHPYSGKWHLFDDKLE